MKSLTWKYDPLLDAYTGLCDEHRYYCMRTAFDVAVLRYNGEEIRRSASDGSHANNIEFAESHFELNFLSLREEK